LTYANSFPNPWVRGTIKTIEWMTGKLTVLRRVRQFERWVRSPDRISGRDDAVMGIDLRRRSISLTASRPRARRSGRQPPARAGRRDDPGRPDRAARPDYRILTRALLTGLDESAASFMIPVPFPHEPDAQEKMLEMRAAAMEHLEKNGLIALFPSGAVAASDSMFGPAIEGEWNVFTAKMIRKSGATIVPFYFTGSNSRWYQIANRISPVLRQGLLIHEVVHAFDKPQAPVIGNPSDPMNGKTASANRASSWRGCGSGRCR
jgi:hypothetical protein